MGGSAGGCYQPLPYVTGTFETATLVVGTGEDQLEIPLVSFEIAKKEPDLPPCVHEIPGAVAAPDIGINKPVKHLCDIDREVCCRYWWGALERGESGDFMKHYCPEFKRGPHDV